MNGIDPPVPEVRLFLVSLALPTSSPQHLPRRDVIHSNVIGYVLISEADFAPLSVLVWPNLVS